MSTRAATHFGSATGVCTPHRPSVCAAMMDGPLPLLLGGFLSFYSLRVVAFEYKFDIFAVIGLTTKCQLAGR